MCISIWLRSYIYTLLSPFQIARKWFNHFFYFLQNSSKSRWKITSRNSSCLKFWELIFFHWPTAPSINLVTSSLLAHIIEHARCGILNRVKSCYLSRSTRTLFIPWLSTIHFVILLSLDHSIEQPRYGMQIMGQCSILLRDTRWKSSAWVLIHMVFLLLRVPWITQPNSGMSSKEKNYLVWMVIKQKLWVLISTLMVISSWPPHSIILPKFGMLWLDNVSTLLRDIQESYLAVNSTLLENIASLALSIGHASSGT